MVKRKKSNVLLASFLFAGALVASAEPDGSTRFSWTTESTAAKELLLELQERIENFQFGTGTVEVARELVAADPDFAMGAYYLSAVVPPPESDVVLEKAITLAKNASDAERRFIEAMATARANGGASFADAIPRLEELAIEYPNERLIQMILGQLYQGTGDGDKARAAFARALV